MSEIKWAKVSEVFGSAWEFGSCNAITEAGVICGWPRTINGICRNGHPAPPPQVPARAAQRR